MRSRVIATSWPRCLETFTLATDPRRRCYRLTVRRVPFALPPCPNAPSATTDRLVGSPPSSICHWLRGSRTGIGAIVPPHRARIESWGKRRRRRPPGGRVAAHGRCGAGAPCDVVRAPNAGLRAAIKPSVDHLRTVTTMTAWVRIWPGRCSSGGSRSGQRTARSEQQRQQPRRDGGGRIAAHRVVRGRRSDVACRATLHAVGRDERRPRRTAAPRARARSRELAHAAPGTGRRAPRASGRCDAAARDGGRRSAAADARLPGRRTPDKGSRRTAAHAATAGGRRRCSGALSTTTGGPLGPCRTATDPGPESALVSAAFAVQIDPRFPRRDRLHHGRRRRRPARSFAAAAAAAETVWVANVANQVDRCAHVFRGESRSRSRARPAAATSVNGSKTLRR